MTEQFYTFLEFAKLLNVRENSIWHIIDVGDITPHSIIDDYQNKRLPAIIDSLRFSYSDIESFKKEFRRRRHEEFKIEYADVYRPDDGPGARGLEFGPGWIGILKEYCDQLRLWQADGWSIHLRWAKEKFGALRIFADDTHYNKTPLQSYWLNRTEERARRQSLRTCHECGQPGRLRLGVHAATLCDRHKHLVGEPRADDGRLLDPDRQEMQDDGTVKDWPAERGGPYSWIDADLGLDEGVSMSLAKQMEVEFKPFLSPDLRLDGTDIELADLRKKLLAVDKAIGPHHEVKFQKRNRGYEIAINTEHPMSTVDEIGRDAIIAEIEMIMRGEQL